MKIGEIYTLLKQAYPKLTKRMFTHFYNLALQNISENVRISVVEEEITDGSYSNLPSLAVRIDSILTEQLALYQIKDNEIVFIDDNGDETTPDWVYVKYWKRVADAIDPPESISPDPYDLIILDGAVGADEDMVNKYLVLDEDVLELVEPGDTTLLTGDIVLYSVSGSTVSLKKASKDNLYELETVDVSEISNGTYSVHLLEDTWEEQDDGFNDDVQMCAMYLCGSLLVEFSGESPESIEFSSKRYAQWMAMIKKRYNSSKIATVIKQVGY